MSNKLTESILEREYVMYMMSAIKDIRFGQYIFNTYDVEVDNSYNNPNHEQVYNMLLSHINNS